MEKSSSLSRGRSLILSGKDDLARGSAVHGRPGATLRIRKGLILYRKRVDSLARLLQARAVLLFQLGFDLVQREECRGSFNVGTGG